MINDYRSLAKQSLERAKQQLASNDIDRLKYAALELRFAIEALTYDRVRAYQKDIGSADYQKWQPKKLMQVLLEINPYADKGGAISIGEEKEGKPATEMVLVGKEVVFSLSNIKSHYDALGSFLHMPSLKQMDAGGHSPEKIKDRCNDLVMVLDKVLASTVFNVAIANTVEIDCERCGALITRRIPFDVGSKRNVSCFECDASYTVIAAENGSHWYPLKQRIDCPNAGCGGKITFWKADIKVGTKESCSKCKSTFEVILGLGPSLPSL